MHLVHSAGGLAAALATSRRSGRRIALVPTMGNLHDGHLALVEHAREVADCVVVSIFVNPLQFAPDEDYARYPRTLEADAARLEQAGVDLLFAPAVETMYPNGYPPATVVRTAGPVTSALEGAHRPGHFDGVTTVVAILFNRVRPDVAVFGEKDWQQLAAIRRMNGDLGMGIEILGHPTVRAADGLALSSRNQYLSVDERARAPLLQRALRSVAEALAAGRRDFAALCAEQVGGLRSNGFVVDYLEVSGPDLEPASPEDAEFVVLAAARLGGTRLIDNLRVGVAQNGAGR